MSDNLLLKLKEKLLLALFKTKSKLDHFAIDLLCRLPLKLMGITLLLLMVGSFLVLYLIGFSPAYIMYLYWRMLRRFFVMPDALFRALI